MLLPSHEIEPDVASIKIDFAPLEGQRRRWFRASLPHQDQGRSLLEWECLENLPDIVGAGSLLAFLNLPVTQSEVSKQEAVITPVELLDRGSLPVTCRISHFLLLEGRR